MTPATEQTDQAPRTHIAKTSALQALVTLILSGSLTGCVVVGGSSRGGFFIWPGGLGLVVLIAFIVFVLRRR